MRNHDGLTNRRFYTSLVVCPVQEENFVLVLVYYVHCHCKIDQHSLSSFHCALDCEKETREVLANDYPN